MKLAGKVCVVMGGAEGIGNAIVELYAREGGRVAVVDVDGPAAAARVDSLRSRGVDAVAVECDVADRESVVTAADEVVTDLGPCDVLVNNSGIALIGPSVDFPEEQWRRSIDIMETGLFFCCQVFGRQMIEKGGGAIVNIASINAAVAFPMRLAFSAAKAAAVSMTQVLAIEWAQHRVRVNAIGPGVIRTERVDSAIREGLVDERLWVERTPMKRFGRPEDIAKAALFLASEEDSSFVTGQFLVVDGGWSACGYLTA